MNPERWAEISPLLDELLELDEEEQRKRLAAIAIEQQELAWELERLLGLSNRNSEFMSSPIVDPEHLGYRPGQHIGPYRLDALLGEGGMGQVWLAYRADGLYERKVALKLLRPGLGDVGLQVRFQRERQVLARLEHPNIARLIDAGISKRKQPYLALEYVDGLPITRYAKQLDLSLSERLRLFLQVAEAVSHAHSSLVIHRDLKPSNILVTMLGDARLLDFGIAQLLDEKSDKRGELTRGDQRTFTLHYAAPEQILSEPTGTMTDVYSLGVVLYELLTGEKPYSPDRDTDAAWEEAILTSEPVLASQAAIRSDGTASEKKKSRKLGRQLRGDLDNILRKAMAKNPADRYASINAFAMDVERYQQGQMVSARAPNFFYALGKYVKRHVLAISAFSLISLVLLSSSVVMWVQGQRITEQADRAQALQAFLISLFEGAEGQRNAGTLDVSALLDAGEGQANRELLQQPLARAEVLGLIARLRIGLQQHHAALDLLRHQQDIINTLDDRPVALEVEAAIMRARIFRALDQPLGCRSELRMAQSHISKTARQHPLLLGQLHTQIGRCLLVENPNLAAQQFKLSARYFERSAVSLDDSIQNVVDLAEANVYLGQPEEALKQLYEALDRLRLAGKEASAQGILIYQVMAQAAGATGARRDQEDALRRSVDLAVAHFGNTHPAARQARINMALSLSWQQPSVHSATQLGQINGPEVNNSSSRDSLEAELDLARVSLALSQGLLSEARSLRALDATAPVAPVAIRPLLNCLRLEADLLSGQTIDSGLADSCHFSAASSVDFIAYSELLRALEERRREDFAAARVRLEELLSRLVFLVGEKDPLSMQARIFLIQILQTLSDWPQAEQRWLELHAQMLEQSPSAEAWLEAQRLRAELVCAAPESVLKALPSQLPEPEENTGNQRQWRSVFQSNSKTLNCSKKIAAR